MPLIAGGRGHQAGRDGARRAPDRHRADGRRAARACRRPVTASAARSPRSLDARPGRPSAPPDRRHAALDDDARGRSPAPKRSAEVDVLENRALRIAHRRRRRGRSRSCSRSLLIRRRVMRLDSRVLLVSVPAFFVVYYALIGTVGQRFSPSLLPAQGHLAGAMCEVRRRRDARAAAREPVGAAQPAHARASGSRRPTASRGPASC